jgi:HEAT repeat protein
MYHLPRGPRTRVALAVGLTVAAVAAFWFVGVYRPWEQPRYLDWPASWWEREYRGVKWQEAGYHRGFELVIIHPAQRVEPGWWDRLLARAGLRTVGGAPDRRLLGGDPQAVPVLARLLQSPAPEVRTAGAFGLARAGPAAGAAAPLLWVALEDEEFYVRISAREALSNIDSDALAAHDREARRREVPVLAGQLDSPDAEARGRAAERLRQIGAEARPAMPALRRALRDPDEEVRWCAAKALLEVDPGSYPDVVPTLVVLLGSRNDFQRAVAADRLGELGARARPGVPALLRRLGDPVSSVRGAARGALERIDPAALAAYDREHPGARRDGR